MDLHLVLTCVSGGRRTSNATSSEEALQALRIVQFLSLNDITLRYRRVFLLL